MKNCQEQKRQLKFNKKFSLFFINKKIGVILVLSCLIFSLVGLFLLQPKSAKGVVPIQTQDQILAAQQKVADAEKKASFWEKFTWERAKQEAWRIGAIAYKTGLSYFLNQLAYDTATKLATGDWGQSPLIEHRTFKDVFKETADNAAGYFIESLGKQGFGGAEFNLCEPDFAIQYKITLGLQKYHKPAKPACTFSEMKENWEEELRDPNFLPKFQNMFNPWENDLGIALTLQTGLSTEIDKKVSEEGLEKLANQGFKPVTDLVSGFIKTPAQTVRDFAENTIEKSNLDYFTYTGSAIADAIDIFVNTLIGKLIDEWLGEGIVTDFPEPKTWEYDYESQSGTEGIAGARDRFRSLIEPEFGVRGDYNILSELVSCPDPTKAGPTNCVIIDSFRQAVINHLTVGQAMDQGYLNPEGIFGFTADGLEPAYYEGYPYRSMIILRKFRIIPVGWELAAQYIQGNTSGNSSVSTIHTFTVSQAGNTWILPNTFSSSLDPASFYDYCDGQTGICSDSAQNQSSSEGLKAYMKGDRSIIFVYYDESAGEHSVGFLHDCSTALDAGCEDTATAITDECLEDELNLVEFTVDSITPGNTIVVTDDGFLPRSAPLSNCQTMNDCIGVATKCFVDSGYSKDVSDSLANGDHWWWKHGQKRTDGGMIRMPAGNWSITVTPNFINGFNQWAVIDGEGQEILLNMNEPVTISKTVITSENSTAGTGRTSDARNLIDLVSCFEPGGEYDTYFAPWCQGLVDPSWVLKAPLNYCKREGPGPEIISEQVTGEGEDSELSIYRNNNYCADEQSCIKENNDGSCQLYGYCTEERRKWLFNSDSCEPQYNTCQTFRSRDGQTVSYLENTLDFGICNADNVGCEDYCTDYDFANDSWNCTLSSTGDKLYLDNDAEECDSSSEGCHELIRIKTGLGANVLTNSSFEDSLDNSIWLGDGTQITDSYDGWQALELSAPLIKAIKVAPADYIIIGQAWTLSFYAKNCSLGDEFGIEADRTTLNQGSDWQYYQTSYLYPPTTSSNQVSLTINSSSCIIDAIKLEQGTTATAYSDYRGNGLTYLKLAPDYLDCDGINDPIECNNFSRECNQNEVGCELYTSISDDITIPAKVTIEDYCAAECVGYDTYIQGETKFDSLRDAYFIPSTARTCNAEVVGCDEFTNLDEVDRGGEGIEYYSYLRQCVKPSDPGTNCAEFYTWEGSDETGYQLKVHSFEADPITREPVVTEDDSLDCNAVIQALPATDPSYNSDCREFYNNSGQISYHLYSQTISCTEDCHPYRRAENNIDPSLTDAASCSAVGSGYANVTNDQFNWDAGQGVCYFCKNRGEWNSEQGACIYSVVPSQGRSCSASQAGCREYSGNTGNNMRIVLNNDFEGSLEGWLGVDGATAELSSTALIAGEESLYVYNANFTASNEVGSLVEKDKSYVLSFLIRTAGAGQLNAIKLVNGGGEEANFITSPFSISGGWQFYKVNLAKLDHFVDSSESLDIQADGNFYIDDVRLTEISDRYFIVKNSWVTPNTCYQDILGNYVGPTFNLGCGEYHDQDSNIHYLHSFSRICEDSMAGCEIMIDTHNYSDYELEGWNDGGDNNCVGDDDDCIIVPEDNFIYVVYNADKKCSRRDKGCTRLGNPFRYSEDVLYRDIYLNNNPDKYDEILCGIYSVGCEEWTTSEGISYFKDPGNQVCEWRQGVGTDASGFNWYKIKIKRCDNDGSGAIELSETDICLNDNDCSGGIDCILDNNDYACAIDPYKTFGQGGAGNSIEQPTLESGRYWTGLCPADQSGCTEYIDPVSRFSTNILYNADFSLDVDLDTIPDGWSGAGEQQVGLEANTLYILAVEDSNTASLIAENNVFYELRSNNMLYGPYDNITVTSVAGSRASKRFYIINYVSAKLIALEDGVNNGSRIELKQAIIDYQLRDELDKTSCNGIVNFEDGCILFNERKQNGFAKASLAWNADLTVNDGTGVIPEAGVASERNANSLIKVTPDRVCDKWLACRSYIRDEITDANVCYDIGLCDSVDENGNCNSFIISNQINQEYPGAITVDSTSNMSGYTKVGYQNSSENSDYFPLAAMEQEGEVGVVPNGDFEFASDEGYPSGWTYNSGAWDSNNLVVIDNPYTAQEEGIGYAPVGRNFIKLGSTFSATSEWIDVEPGINYILTAYINTINLADGRARLRVRQYNKSGSVIETNNGVVRLGYGNKWTYKLGSFRTRGNAYRIDITLRSNSSTVGNFYFDDVKLRPALETKDLGGKYWYTAQTCRLYPEGDSLSCDYYEDSGIRQKGWLGYCLEYDRYPGSKDACILWWPVDKVKGEGIEEGAGYNDRMPLYYAMSKENVSNTGGYSLVNGDVQIIPRGGGKIPSGCWCDFTYPGDKCGSAAPKCRKVVCPRSYFEALLPDDGYVKDLTTDYLYQIEWDAEDPARPAWSRYNQVLNSSNSWELNVWYYKGSYAGARAVFSGGILQEVWFINRDGSSKCGSDHDMTFYARFFFRIKGVTTIVQVVTPMGQNKYWSGRTYQGSDYLTSQGYDYPTVTQPFGSLPNISSVSNPDNWSVIEEEDPSQWQPHTQGSVGRLFAQSYGIWTWNGSNYVKSTGDWTPPENLCAGGSRPGYPNDLCGIPPTISNIKVNNQTNNVVIGKNQFISLTFNSDVDQEQMPMVMYAVNWGDGENTVVTGVEMRDRATAENPHIMYHLYGYWDLKAKNASGVSIECQDDCSGYGVNGRCCTAKPSIKIKDNWGWCNNIGGAGPWPCPNEYKPFGGLIVVSEK